MRRTFRPAVLLPLFAVAASGCSDNPQPTVDAGSDVVVVVDAPVTDAGPADTGPADTGPADAGPMCPSVEFVRPTTGAVLGVSDDADHNCSNGFAYTVQLATNAAVGLRLGLYVNGRQASTSVVAGPTVTFPAVQLDTGATTALEVRLIDGATSCATSRVTVNCNVPRCSVTTPTRALLNASDSTASTGMPFATTVVVGTDVEDGRAVALNVTGLAAPLSAQAMGGSARFTGVAMNPDGDFVVRATCTNAAGNVGQSADTRFTVDSVAPTLSGITPADNVTVGLMSDVDATLPGTQFHVCAHSDAAGRTLCANVAGASPAASVGCATVPATATMETCVEVTCPDGGAPFNVDVHTDDAAGNVASHTVLSVRCQSALPSVRITAPRAYAAGDPTTILNASRDIDTATPGLQADVVACVDRGGGMAALTRDGVTTPLATATVAATSVGDPCAMLGMGFVGIARFPHVTLPQTFPTRSSAMDPAPTAPALTVTVTDPSGDVGASAPAVLYVDSLPPTVSVYNCNRLVRPGTDGSGHTSITIASEAYPATLTLTHTGSTPTTLTASGPTMTGGTATFDNVTLATGVTTLQLTATDPAGNSASTDGMCTITVGNPPALAFTSPAAMAVFTTTHVTNVTLSTDAPNGTVVSLAINGGVAITSTAVGGVVTYTGVTLPEADTVNLVATTADVPGRGVGTASVVVKVDTQVPVAPGGLALSIPTTPRSARRAGTVHLTWTDGSDPTAAGTGSRPVSRYEIRYSTVALMGSNFTGGTLATVSATPGAPGAANAADLNGLQLGRAYYVAMRSVDGAGNVSPTVVSAGPITPDLIVDQLSNAMPPLGFSVSGGMDFNGDGIDDLVVGSGNSATSVGGLARIYFGSASGVSATTFVEFHGAASDGRFGTAVAALGDVNGDGIDDLAIGEPGPSAVGSTRGGVVYLFFGRHTASWRTGSAAAYTPMDADVTISGGTGGLATARLGTSLSRLGDFDGDGLADVVAGAPNATGGGAVVVFKGRRTWPATLTPNAAELTITNNGSNAFFGFTLAGLGRVVGADALEDLAIGSGAVATPGVTYIYAGRALPTAVSLGVTDATFTRAGIVPGSVTGTGPGSTVAQGQIVAAGVGDVDGDGRSDVAISNITALGGPGEVFLYFGAADGSLTAGPSIRSPEGLVGDVFGRSLASVVDPTVTHPSLLQSGASTCDLLVGSQAYQLSTSRLAIYRGRAAAAWAGVTSLNPDRVVTSASTGSLAGISGVAWLGDIDGDGGYDAAFAEIGTGTLYIVH